MRSHSALNAVPVSKIDLADPAKTAMEGVVCPPLPGFGKDASKKRPAGPPSEVQLFRFIDSEGKFLCDETGRAIFSMLPSTAQRLAEAMDATAKRV